MISSKVHDYDKSESKHATSIRDDIVLTHVSGYPRAAFDLVCEAYKAEPKAQDWYLHDTATTWPTLAVLNEPDRVNRVLTIMAWSSSRELIGVLLSTSTSATEQFIFKVPEADQTLLRNTVTNVVNGHIASISKIATAVRWQRKGIAQRMISEVVPAWKARNRPVHVLTASVHKDNFKSLALHQKAAHFEKVKTTDDHGRNIRLVKVIETVSIG